MRPANKTTGPRLRLVLEPDVAIGPGKIDLLDQIRETGSIAAAGRRMRMSYKRAWLLVEEMNQAFREPAVTTTRGGAEKGGAALTALGIEVLDRYRRMEAETERAIAGDLAALRSLLAAEAGAP